MRLNLKLISEVFSAVKEYLFSHQKFTNKFSTINNIDDLGIFIRQRSSFVTQTTLYGYLKTRMGLKYTLMFSDDIFLQSINKSKWNIFVEALGDLTLFTVSNLMSKGKINDFNLSNFYNNILDEEIKNQMPPEFVQIAKDNFKVRVEGVDLINYFKNEPFRLSGQALYKWSPIADELKILDKEVVLNSIKNKWNTVTSDFEKLSSKFKI